MKKIFALTGSMRGTESYTARFAQMLIDEIDMRSDVPFESEILTADKWNILYCRGCMNCFRNGSCPLDMQDEMGILRKKLLEADIIIAGSPVYAAALSGITKTFIDRSSLWLHTMPLIGKTAAIISTTDNNNPNAVVPYMKNTFEHMGAAVVFEKNVFTGQGEPNIFNLNDMKNELAEGADRLAETLCGKLPPVSDYMRQCFFYLSKRYRKQERLLEFFPRMPQGEYQLWKDSGYFDCNTIDEAMQLRLSEVK